MKLLKRVPLRVWIILAACIIICVFSYARVLINHELALYDLRFKLRPPQKISSDIILIEISDDTLKNLDKWPLPRDFHATMTDVLKESGARMIVFDLIFNESTPYDEVFAESIRKADNVYLPVVFRLADRVDKMGIPEASELLADLNPLLKQDAKSIGYINFYIDPDGKARRAPLFIKYNNVFFPQLAFKAAADWLGLNIGNRVFKKNRLIIDNRLFLPLSTRDSLLVNYPDQWVRSFKHFSYFEILKSYIDTKKGLKPNLDLSVIKDKVCFIGLTATGTSDLSPNPLEGIYPMLGLQASIFNSIVSNNFITDVGPLANTLLNLLVFALSLFIFLKFSPLKAFLGNIALGLIYFIFSVLLFMYGIWIDLAFPVFIIGSTYIGSTAYRFFNETKKRQLLEKELDIARTIQKNFLPSDIKGFSGLSICATMRPAKFVAGDLYDVLTTGEGKVGIFIADVSGKGVPASLIMAQTISLFRIFARQHNACSEVLDRLNKELYGKFAGRFVTALYIIIDSKNKSVQVSSAGHSPLLFYQNQTNRLSEVELSAGLPLGVMEDTDYGDVSFDISKDDKIVVFTDGLSEARNKEKEEFGLDKIKKIIFENAHLSSDALLEAMENEINKFSYRAIQHDDITLIALTKSA